MSGENFDGERQGLFFSVLSESEEKKKYEREKRKKVKNSHAFPSSSTKMSKSSALFVPSVDAFAVAIWKGPPGVLETAL